MRCIRATFGKSSVQKGIKSALHDHKNILESLFEVKKIPMESYGGAITSHSVVYCVHVDLFINRITTLRPNTENDFTVKFGINYGQSFLKVIMTLATPSRHSSGQRNSSLNGGKKTMLLAVCQAPTTCANLKSHFTLLNAPPDLECVYACDLKVSNIATGLSSHSSRHPCPYCTSKPAHWD